MSDICNVSGLKINLGAGYDKTEGFITLDDDPNTNPDYLIDLEKDRLPFEDSSVEEVKAHHVLEHIGEGFIPLMLEIYRVCKHGAVIDIAVPNHMHETFYGDPTHKRPITVNTFYLFSKKYNKNSIEQKLSNSTLGLRYNVDFEVVWYDYKIDPFYENYMNNYRQRESSGQLSDQDRLSHMRLMREAWNVSTDVMIKLTVIKNA